MSGPAKNDSTRSLLARPGYEIGSAKPPVAARFKPGQSGNPLGRPKGSKNKRHTPNEERMKEIILSEAYRTIAVRDGDSRVNAPMAQAIIRSLAVNAAKGQHRAQRLFADLLASTERERAALDYKIAWERELDRREAFGIRDLAPPLPHPDHVVVDVLNGTVRIAGPATKEEKADWDDILGNKAILEDSVAQLIEANENETDPEEIEDNLKFIMIGEEKLKMIRKLIP